MGKYIVRRLLQMIPVIIGATFLIFVVVFALPGDPVQGRCGERPCPPSYVAAFRAEYNLDKPVVVQYLPLHGQCCSRVIWARRSTATRLPTSWRFGSRRRSSWLSWRSSSRS